MKVVSKEKVLKTKPPTVQKKKQVLSKNKAPPKKKTSKDVKEKERTIDKIVDDVNMNMALFGDEEETNNIRDNTGVKKG